MTKKDDIPFEELSFCMNANLRRTMRATNRLYNAALKPVDLKATQFTLLAVIASQKSTPITKLSEALEMDRTTLTRNLAPLIKKGWVELGKESDERIRPVAITQSGLDLLQQAVPLWRNAQGKVTAALGTSGIENANAALTAIRKHTV